MPKEGEAFEVDPPEPDWLEPPRQCGHAWRNNDFTCMDCVEARITDLQRELAFYFGRWHSEMSGHRADGLACTENECVRVRQLAINQIADSKNRDQQ